jgi:hypothetical protein
MPDLHDHDSLGLVVHAVDHAVIALTHTIVFEPRELFTVIGARFSGEPFDSGDDPTAVFGGDGLQLLEGRRFDQQAIACYAASGP